MKMNKNKKECIDALNYNRKAFTKGTMYQYDAFIDVIDTLIRYFENENAEIQTMTNADKIIQLLQNPDENVEEFNSLIPVVINCPMYIENNYDGFCNATFCNMSNDSASCLECTKDWLYKEVTNEVLEV